MRKYVKAGASVVLWTMLTLGCASAVAAQEPSSEVGQTTQVEQTTTEEAVHITTEEETETTTAHEKVTEQKATKKTTKKVTKKKAEKKKKGSKDRKKKKDSSKIIPKVYNDTRIEMKDQKETINGFIYFNQADEAWNQNGYHIHQSGCGPTAMAVCISSLTEKWVTPLDTAIWAFDNGYYNVSGAVHEMIPALAKEYQLNCTGLGTDIKNIRKALKAKHPVVALMGPGYFTKKGHFIVLVGIDDKDQVTVADVGSRKRSEYKYPLTDVVKQTKEASAGGPCWEISKPEERVKTKKKKKEKKKKHSADFTARYNDMKSVLQKNFELMVPMKKGTLVKEEQFVTVDSFEINDTVTVTDSKSTIKSKIQLETVVEEMKTEAVHGSFWRTVVPLPSKMNENSLTN